MPQRARSVASICCRESRGRLFQIDLVPLDDPAGQVAGIVRHHVAGRERLDLPKELEIDPFRAGDQFVVEQCESSPAAGVQLTSRLSCFRRARSSRCPSRPSTSRDACASNVQYRQVDAFDGVGEGALPRACSAQATVAGTSARMRSRALGSETSTAAATRAGMDRRSVRTGPTARSHRSRSGGRPCPHRKRKRRGNSGSARTIFCACQPRSRPPAGERLDQIVLDDQGARRRAPRARRRLGSAERTNQRLLGGIPVRVGAAGGTVKLVARVGDGRRPTAAVRATLIVRIHGCYLRNCGDLRARQPPLRADFLPFRSPASRLAMTSASVTPSTCAASAGLKRLGHGRGAAAPPARLPASPAPRCRPAG